ncbi:26S proteasome non-ATPase regulatory subunit 5 [Brachionus plicatilis]|uniref:26S proteasome non-ATPase regulatory subunit 5 n=1 Tax=Brachionus plicatilis TaxID=10195 RepID=A0A3M7QVU5_BRAPC|nr:26S proteasome non-ATPase regulatory subunit 5 [Brachionus plicatilis]
MTCQESAKLVELFDSIISASSFKQKSEILSHAKHFIFNQMTNEEIREFFVKNAINFQTLFSLDIWTKNLEDSGGIVDYPEAYDIIERIFHTFKSLNDLVNSFYDQVVFILTQNVDEKVKHVCVKCFLEFTKQLDSTNIGTDFQSREDLVSKLKNLLVIFVQQIPNTAPSYSNILSDFVCFLTVRLNKIEAKFQEDQRKVHVFTCSVFDDNQDLLNLLSKISSQNSILSFRVMEMFIRLGSISDNHLMSISEQKYHLSKQINHFLNDPSDLLSQLNCIELLGDLVVPAHGYHYVLKCGYLKNLISYLDASPESDKAILLPSIVKLFAHVTKERPQETKEHFAKFYTYLFQIAMDENLIKNSENISFAIETFCYLFESNLVKKFIVENYKMVFLRLLERFVWITKNCINEKIKTNALRCLCELFSPDPSLLDCDDADIKWKNSHWITSEWIHMSKEIYEHVTLIISHENFFNICLCYAKEPFAENRKSAHLYFKALSQTEWGLRLLFTPNKFNCDETFLDAYLLNRSIELDKPSLESKLEMIKLMVVNFESNPTLVNIIGNVTFEKLKHYVNEGAFWVKGESSVAFESV